MFISDKMLGKPRNAATPDEVAKARESFLAICFLQRADENRYGELQDELKKRIIKGRDEYPQTVADAYDLLLKTSKQIGYKKNRFRTRNGQWNRNNQNFVFAQKVKKDEKSEEDITEEAIAGTDGVIHKGVKCYSCQDIRHYSAQCPKNV